MSTTWTSRVTEPSMTAIVPEIILPMPSFSAASISLSPRFSRQKSIFCLEYTCSPFTLLRTVFSPSRVKSRIHSGTGPRARISMTPITRGPSAVAIDGPLPRAGGGSRLSCSRTPETTAAVMIASRNALNQAGRAALPFSGAPGPRAGGTL